MLPGNPSTRRWKLPELTITGRKLVVSISGVRLVILLLSFAVLMWGIYYQVRVDAEGGWALVSTGVIVLLPIAIGILLAPRQRTEDHSATASLAVRELQELRRSQATIAEDLRSMNLNVVEVDDRFRILKSIEELNRESQQVERSMERWLEVSPTVVQDAINQQLKHAALLAKMEREWTTSEEEK